MFNRPRIAIALVFLLVFVLSSCADESPLSPSSEETLDYPTPSLSISDGAHGAGNEHFYFLPPLVRNPKASGIFDPSQSPVVEICELSGDLCADILATYSMDSGAGADRVRVNANKENYQVNWATGLYGLREGATVRVHVRAGATELGHLDVLLTGNGGNRKATGDHAKIELGTTVGIKFRIEEGAVPEQGVKLGPDAVVVDPAVLEVLSDEAERETGVFRFRAIGTPPAIAAGKIIIGATGDGGFLRRVTSVSVSGDVITLQTGPASLTEAVEDGDIHMSFVVQQPTTLSGQVVAPGNTTAQRPERDRPGPTTIQLGELQPTFLAQGVNYSANSLSLSGTDLCKDLLSGLCPDWTSLTIEEGSIGFTPEIDAKAEIEDFSLESFHIIGTGTLALDLLVKAEATQEFTADGEIKLAELGANFYAQVGGLPVTGTVTYKFIAGFEAKANLKTSYQTGATAATQIRVGARYANESWEGVWETGLSTGEKESEWTAQADGEVRVYVRPELHLRFYRIAGPSIQVEPWVKAEGHVGTEQCEMAITGGMDAKLSFIIEFLSTELANWNTDFNTDPVDIFKYPCPIGDLKVTTATTGVDLDTDGYTVTLDGADPKPLDADGEVTYTTLPATTYLVGLTGVADNCTVSGDNPKQVEVTAGETADAPFAIECAGETGDLKVSVTTSGDNPDPDGYTVSVDGTQSQGLGANASLTFEGLAVGDHSVRINGVADNCTVSGDNPATTTVETTATVEVSWQVACAANRITVLAQTGGTPIDPDGYTVTLDDSDSESLAVNGSVVFEPVTAGTHKLEVTGMAANCSVHGDNPRNVAVTDGGAAETAFVVSCSGGALVINTSTFGSESNLDPDGYTVVVDDTYSLAIGIDDQVSFPGLSTGTHSVELQGVNDPCVVLGFNPRDSSAPGVVTFEVDCGGTDGGITFVSGADIWQISPDGSNEQQLTTDGAWYGFPHWTPDGSRVVFSRPFNCGTGQGACTAIFTADPDGSNRTQVSFPVTSTHDEFPRWSHQGDRISFQRQIETGVGTVWEIVTVDATGTNPATAISGVAPTVSYVSPTWTPSGQIVFVESASAEEGPCSVWITIISADGSGLNRLTDDLGCVRVGRPDVSPDGSRIAFTIFPPSGGSTPEIYVMQADGSGLASLGVTSGSDVGAPAWSPDGSQIAFVGGNENDVWLMNADGSNPVQLTTGYFALFVDWRATP